MIAMYIALVAEAIVIVGYAGYRWGFHDCSVSWNKGFHMLMEGKYLADRPSPCYVDSVNGDVIHRGGCGECPTYLAPPTDIEAFLKGDGLENASIEQLKALVKKMEEKF